MLQVLHMGLHVCQLIGYEQINHGLALITTNSAKTLNLSHTQYGIQSVNIADLLILPAKNGFDAVRPQIPILYSIRNGKIIASTKSTNCRIFKGREEIITFK